MAPGIELSRYSLRGAFPIHLHLGALVVLIERGSQVLEVGGEVHTCRRGDVLLLGPEEAHRNYDAGDHVSYRTFHLVLERVRDRLIDQFRIRDRCIRDPTTFRSLLDLHRSLETPGAPASEAAVELVQLFETRVEPSHEVAECIRTARAILRRRSTDPISLPGLAAEAGVSVPYLCHRFRSDLGISPHAYLDALRVERAREEIRSGHSFARVAADCGFYDQSHLIRRFRRIVGQTPAAFARAKERPILLGCQGVESEADRTLGGSRACASARGIPIDSDSRGALSGGGARGTDCRRRPRYGREFGSPGLDRRVRRAALAPVSDEDRGRWISRLALQHWRSHRWTVESVCSIDESHVTARVRNDLAFESDSLDITFEPGSTRIRDLSVTAGVRVHLTPGDTATLLSRLEALDRYVERQANAGVFSGVVLVDHAGQVVYGRAVGRMNEERLNTLETRFNLASVSKIFTATALLQLVADGQLDLTDTLGSILPDSMMPGGIHRIPIETLLTHTSGIVASGDSLVGTPGTVFSYSNAGYGLLGDVIETISGERYEDYLLEHVLRPAGCTRLGGTFSRDPWDTSQWGTCPRSRDR